jgi:septal ring factor EnvC (AmiA/AmiB activator)
MAKKDKATNLIPLENVTANELFSADDKSMTALLAGIEREARSLVKDMDVTKEEDRKEIASVAYKVARSKTTIDDAGKDFAADLKKQAKVIDTRRKEARDALDDLKFSIREDLDEWETKEQKRIDKHTEAIEIMRKTGNEAMELFMDLTLDQIKDSRVVIEAMDPAKFEEFSERAEETRLAALAKIDTAIQKREQYDKDQADLERMRKEQAEREEQDRMERLAQQQKEAEEKAAAEAEEKARKEEQEKAAERERQLIAEKEEAERKQREAEEKAEEERLEREAEERREREEQEKRERNTRHKGQCNTAAVEALVETCNLSTEDGRKVITAIAKGQIPRVTIGY